MGLPRRASVDDDERRIVVAALYSKACINESMGDRKVANAAGVNEVELHIHNGSSTRTLKSVDITLECYPSEKAGWLFAGGYDVAANLRPGGEMRKCVPMGCMDPSSTPAFRVTRTYVTFERFRTLDASSTSRSIARPSSRCHTWQRRRSCAATGSERRTHTRS